jgi:hypothetical protein
VRAAYGHYEALTFSDYLDLDTGKTLHAEPGRTYDIAPASGRVVPEFPEPWFTAAEPLAIEAGEPDFAAGPADDFVPGAEPETPEG